MVFWLEAYRVGIFSDWYMDSFILTGPLEKCKIISHLWTRDQHFGQNYVDGLVSVDIDLVILKISLKDLPTS